MRRIILLVLLLVAAMVITLMVAVATAPKAAAAGCTLHDSSDYRTVSKWGGDLEKHTWQIMHEVRYRHCWKRVRGKHWVDPIHSVYGCRQIDAEDSALRWVRMNNRFWDFDGHSINPSYVQLECNSESWTTVERWYLKETRLHKCAKGAPRWKADVKFNIYGELDVFTTLSSSFWGYFLPTIVDC